MMNLENKVLSEFDEFISKAVKKSNGYLDLTPDNENFVYTDRNHLEKSSGTKVSEIIALWITEQRRKHHENDAFRKVKALN